MFRTRITLRDGHSLIAENGSRCRADIAVLAICLKANSVVAGLPRRSEHGLRINATLSSLADERVFASGDCTVLEGLALPKLAVFGVR